MQNKIIKLASLIFGIYITIGILLWPSWWFNVIYRLDVRAFSEQVFGWYFNLNVSIVAITSALSYWYYHANSSGKPWAAKLTKILNWKLLPGAIFMLIAIGMSRAAFVAMEDTVEFATDEQKFEVNDLNNVAVNLPIEILFSDKYKIDEAFGQIQGDLRLSEKKISEKNSIGLSSSAAGGIASASAEVAREGETASTYQAVDSNQSQKLVKFLRYLKLNHALVGIKSIELQSQDLKEFDKAVEILTDRYDIPISQTLVDSRRRTLIESNLKDAAPREFKIGSWVVISGKVSFSTIGKYSTVKFEYVPSLPSRVSFSCSVPTADLKMQQPVPKKDHLAVDMRIFGKIASVDNQSSQSKYDVSCFAFFR